MSLPSDSLPIPAFDFDFDLTLGPSPSPSLSLPALPTLPTPAQHHFPPLDPPTWAHSSAHPAHPSAARSFPAQSTRPSRSSNKTKARTRPTGRIDRGPLTPAQFPDLAALQRALMHSRAGIAALPTHASAFLPHHRLRHIQAALVSPAFHSYMNDHQAKRQGIETLHPLLASSPEKHPLSLDTHPNQHQHSILSRSPSRSPSPSLTPSLSHPNSPSEQFEPTPADTTRSSSAPSLASPRIKSEPIPTESFVHLPHQMTTTTTSTTEDQPAVEETSDRDAQEKASVQAYIFRQSRRQRQAALDRACALHKNLSDHELLRLLLQPLPS